MTPFVTSIADVEEDEDFAVLGVLLFAFLVGVELPTLITKNILLVFIASTSDDSVSCVSCHAGLHRQMSMFEISASNLLPAAVPS